MNFAVRESDILQVVMGYLRGKGCYEALAALALESNSSIGVLGNDMLYLQKIVLQGRWDTVTRFLEDIKADLGPDVSIRMSFLIQRQRFLELLSWQGGGEQRMAFPPWRPLSGVDKKVEAGDDQNIEMGCILQQLNVLKTLCSTSEFNSLCAFLTVDKLENQPGYEHWTVAQGRWECFSDIRAVLAPLLPGDNTTEPGIDSSLKEGLLNTVAMSLAYQTALSTDIPLEDSHGEHKAQLHLPAGFIVPSRDTRRIQSILNAEGAPSLALVSPVKALRRFDQVVPAPQLGYKVHHVTGASPGRHGKNNESVGIKYSPPRSTPSVNGVVEHHVSVVAPAYLEAHSAVHPHPPQQQPVYQPHPAGIPPPASSVPPGPPAAYGQALPGDPARGSVPDHLAASPQYPQQHQQAPAPLSGQQPQRLSIETGGFQADYRELHNQQPTSAQQPGPVPNQPTSYAYAPGHPSAGPTQPPTEAFTPHNQFPPGYTQPPQYLSYGDVPPSGYAQPYIPAQQQYAPGGYTQDGYSQPHQLMNAGRLASGSAQSHTPQVAVPNQTYIGLPSSQGGCGRAPAVAWTVGQDAAEAEETKPPSSTPKEPGVLAAAFTVGEVDESKVKPMPTALRKKMLADQQAAAAAEEERRRMEQEIAASDRSTSRGRSRSAPRGGAVPVAVAAPPSTGRPVSAVRSRGVGSHIPTPTPALHSQNSPDRGGFAGAVRRSSDQSKVAAAPDTMRQQPSTNGSRNLATAAPGSELSVHSGSHVSRTNNSRVGGGNTEYAPGVLFKTDFPLRCFNALGVSPPDSVRLAVGSNAKAIYTMTYARNQLAASHNLGVMSGTGPGVTLQAELSNIHTGSVYCMDWHEGAGLLVSGSNDKAIRLSNPSNGQVSGVLKEHNGTIRTVKFLGGGSGSEHAGSLLFASAGGGDCATRVWDAQSARVVRALSKHAESVHGLSWLGPDMLLTGCDQGQVIGHDLRSARPAWTYNLNDVLAQSHGETLRRGVCCLTVLGSSDLSSPDSQNLLVAAGCGGGYVTVFNATTGQIHSHKQLHASDVRSLCMMPTVTRRKDDDHFDILTGSYDGTLGLWRASSRGPDFRYTSSRILKGHNDKVLCAAPVAMPGRAECDILSTGADGKAILWSVN